MKLEQFKQVYFVGIGGIGMSALARYFVHLGVTVFGYDRVETALTQQLEQEGMHIHYQDDVAQIPEGIDLVVYTPAIPAEHLELQHFRANGYTIMKRAEVLGLISKSKKTIAVAGTHGKTTTSAILAHLLKVGGVDCSAFLGGIAGNFNSNFVAGESEWVVMEADEFDRSFLQLRPEIAILTSMDADHLDIYGDKESLEQTFLEFAGQVKQSIYYQAGLPIDSQYNLGIDWYNYGINQGTIRANNVSAIQTIFVFDYVNNQNRVPTIPRLEFTLAGHHNVLNALAAISVAKELGVNDKAIREGLATFKGIKRRFELVTLTPNDRAYVDDYAHHPTEIEMAIYAARTIFPKGKITGVFQPHLYSRTRDFATEFAAVLDQLDEVILLDIYPARELPIAGVSSQMILDKMKLVKKELVQKEKLLEVLGNKEIQVLMTLGAGDIGAMVEDIKDLIDNK